MEEKMYSKKSLEIICVIMLFAIIILALIPRKLIFIGSANDNKGEINVDNRTNKNNKTHCSQ